jgi:hypothetical protein
MFLPSSWYDPHHVSGSDHNLSFRGAFDPITFILARKRMILSQCRIDPFFTFLLHL